LNPAGVTREILKITQNLVNLMFYKVFYFLDHQIN